MKLNESYTSCPVEEEHVLTPEQFQKLLDGKFSRAEAYIRARAEIAESTDVS